MSSRFWFLFPAGLYYCFSKLSDHNNIIILYGVFSVYFAGAMVCLILVLAPVMCIFAGIAVSNALSTYMKYLDSGSAAGSSKVQPKDAKARKMDHRFLRVSQVSTGLGLLHCSL